MGFIYVIRNKVNNKVYVGLTCATVDLRFKEHIKATKRYPHRKLYQAINDIGIENFYIETLGDFSDEELSDKEVAFIKQFDSYRNGYNSSPGGWAATLTAVSKAELESNFTGNVLETANLLGLSPPTVRKLLDKHKIPYIKKLGVIPKAITMEELCIKFDSSTECAKFLIDNELTNAKVSSVESGINKVLKGSRQSYLGFTYSYV